MSSFVDNIHVNTAITENTKLDLGHVHITTANFMQFNPVLCKEMVPGEKTIVDMMTFSRLQPLAVPTFGRANIKERAFFVPFRTIFRGWNDFITDTPHTFAVSGAVSSILPSVPLVGNAVLVGLFMDEASFLYGSDVPLGKASSSSDYDLNIIQNDGSNEYIKLSEDGRQVLKILNSLGYKPVWDLRNEDYYSAMPLLAIAKIYCDWYYPSAYVNYGTRWSTVASLFTYDGTSTLYLNGTHLVNIFSWCAYVNYFWLIY